MEDERDSSDSTSTESPGACSPTSLRIDVDPDEFFSAFSASPNPYHVACKSKQTPPYSFILEQIATGHVSIMHYGLSPKEWATILAQLLDKDIITLQVVESDMDQQTMLFLQTVLDSYTSLCELELSGITLNCQLLRPLTQILTNMVTLKKLHLSDDKLTDPCGLPIAHLIQKHPHLQLLDLSRNCFSRTGIVHISKALVYTKSLQVLDLSWNHVRLDGSVELAKALQRNTSLTELHLAMNGFSVEGCEVMQETLRLNETLHVLDLTNNRINTRGAHFLAAGLAHNHALRVLNLNENPLLYHGAHELLSAIHASHRGKIRLLSMENINTDDALNSLIRHIQQRREFVCVTGIKSRGRGDLKPYLDSDAIGKDPITILLEFTMKKNYRLIDLFMSLDKDHSYSITKDEFIRGLKNVEVPLSDHQLIDLMDMLDKDKDGAINLEELLRVPKEHRAEMRRANRNVRLAKQQEANRKDQRLKHLVKRVTSQATLNMNTKGASPQ